MYKFNSYKLQMQIQTVISFRRKQGTILLKVSQKN